MTVEMQVRFKSVQHDVWPGCHVFILDPDTMSGPTDSKLNHETYFLPKLCNTGIFHMNVINLQLFPLLLYILQTAF